MTEIKLFYNTEVAENNVMLKPLQNSVTKPLQSASCILMF